MSSEERWFKYYGDVPHTLDYPDISMYEMIKKAKDAYGEYIAYDFQGKAVTYNKFIEEIDNCAKALIAQGIKEGDAVTICLPNIPQAIIMFYAINKIGAIASMVHPLSAENEIMFYLNESKSRIAITLSQFYNKFQAIEGRTRLEKLIVTKIEEALPPVKGFLYKFIGHEPKVVNESWVVPWPEFISKAQECNKKIEFTGKGEYVFSSPSVNHSFSTYFPSSVILVFDALCIRARTPFNIKSVAINLICFSIDKETTAFDSRFWGV